MGRAIWTESEFGQADWISAHPKFLAQKSRQCVTEGTSSHAGMILRPSNNNDSQETLIHTPAVDLLRQVTLQPSTEPQIATTAAITAMTAINAHIVPNSDCYVHHNDTHYLDMPSTSPALMNINITK